MEEGKKSAPSTQCTIIHSVMVTWELRFCQSWAKHITNDFGFMLCGCCHILSGCDGPFIEKFICVELLGYLLCRLPTQTSSQSSILPHPQSVKVPQFSTEVAELNDHFLYQEISGFTLPNHHLILGILYQAPSLKPAFVLLGLSTQSPKDINWLAKHWKGSGLCKDTEYHQRGSVSENLTLLMRVTWYPPCSQNNKLDPNCFQIKPL